MINNTISIDGVSSAVHQLFFKRLPMFPVALEKVQYYDIAGKPDSMYYHSGKFNDLSLTLEAVLVGFNVDNIIKWIANGKKLVLSNQPDRYAEIKQVEAHEISRFGSGALEMRITFKISPFKYSTDDKRITISSSPYTFVCKGNFYAEPLIMAHDITTDCTVRVNDVSLHLTDFYDMAFIDVKNKMVYIERGGVKSTMLQHTTGEFWNMIFNPGVENRIEFTGCQRLYLYKNERWL